MMVVVVVVNLALLTILELSGLWIKASAASTLANATTLAGCPETCGNVTVPYPFGTVPGCSMPGFNLTCNQTFRPPKLFLGSFEVTEISLKQGLLHAMNPVALVNPMFTTNGLSTEDFSTVVGPYTLPADGLYTLSTAHNVFTALGCGNMASLYGRNGKVYAICAATCPNETNIFKILGNGSWWNKADIPIRNGSCSGIGCCQAPIQPGITSFIFNQQMIINDLFYLSSLKAFLVQKDRFTFSNWNYLYDEARSDLPTTMPFVVGWAAGKSTCAEASRNSTSFACRSSNSRCLNSNETEGYICACSQGYQGNPYLPNGCQDINECELAETNKCLPGNRCINLPGSYKCLPPSSPERRKNSVLLGVTIGVSIAVGLLLLLGIGALLSSKWKKSNEKRLRKKHFHENRGLLMQQLISATEGSTERNRVLPLEELEKATNNFDSTRILGRGGHGTVYKGILSDQRVVAIKKSKLVVRSEIDQFINEVVILSQINHRNIVKLYGCCLETEVPLLVYEFISNGTLYDHLHVRDQNSLLSWEDRLRIAWETAGALAYMHSAASISIFHRDVKSANILLDDSGTAKLSDFGASRSIPLHQTHITTVVQGTFGYLDPEYFHTSQLTEKSDVYSLGVILIELLTGKKPVFEEERNLATHFLISLKENNLFQLVHPTILNDATREKIKAFAGLAATCLSIRGEERPSMKEVELRLLALRSTKKQQHPWRAQINEESSSLLPKSFDTGDGCDASRQFSLEVDFLVSMEHPR